MGIKRGIINFFHIALSFPNKFEEKHRFFLIL
jgi:hypothetical protein